MKLEKLRLQVLRIQLLDLKHYQEIPLVTTIRQLVAKHLKHLTLTVVMFQSITLL